MKKIVIVYSGAKYRGGIEDYLENLFKYHDRKKIELILISLGEWPLRKEVEGLKCDVKAIPGGRIRLQTFFDIKNIVKKEGIDLVVSQGVVANFYARIAAQLAKTPHLTTVHSDLTAEYSNPFINSAYRLSDFLTRPLTKNYITASDYLKKTLIKKGVKKDKIQVIYHGVVTPKVKGRNKGPVVIGSLGRLDKIKGYDNLIKAFSMLGSTDAKLVIWGEGKERSNLESLVKELGLGDKVEMPGYIDKNEGFSQMDIYIQPSLSEGLGLSVIEAMLSRKPVIITPVGGLREIIQDRKTGTVAKSIKPKSIAEAIKKVFDDPSHVIEMVERAEKEAKNKFSVEESINETVKVFLGATLK